MPCRRFKHFIATFLFVGLSVAVGFCSAAETQAELNLNALAGARSGNLVKPQQSIDHSASPNTRNRVGDSLLVAAIKNDHADVVSWLLEHGADVNLANAKQVTPLMTAAFDGRTAMARSLIAKKADINAVDQLHKTAMVYAAGNGHTATVELLLASGVAVNAAYKNNLTALVWASGFGHLPTVQLLMDRGADTAVLDNRGKIAAQMAEENGFAEVATLLRSRK